MDTVPYLMVKMVIATSHGISLGICLEAAVAKIRTDMGDWQVDLSILR